MAAAPCTLSLVSATLAVHIDAGTRNGDRGDGRAQPTACLAAQRHKHLVFYCQAVTCIDTRTMCVGTRADGSSSVHLEPCKIHTGCPNRRRDSERGPG